MSVRSGPSLRNTCTYTQQADRAVPLKVVGAHKIIIIIIIGHVVCVVLTSGSIAVRVVGSIVVGSVRQIDPGARIVMMMMISENRTQLEIRADGLFADWSGQGVQHRDSLNRSDQRVWCQNPPSLLCCEFSLEPGRLFAAEPEWHRS